MRSFIAATMLVIASLAMFVASAQNANAEDVIIDVGNLYFCSATFEDGNCQTTVTAGDTVTWTNVAGFHTVTQCAAGHDPCPAPGGFDSGQLEQGDVFQRTFTDVGTFEYYCVFHPTQMQGTILVQPAPTAAPTATAAPDGAPTAPPLVSTPLSVPRTGGEPFGGGPTLGWLLAVAVGAVFLGLSASLALAAARDR